MCNCMCACVTACVTKTDAEERGEEEQRQKAIDRREFDMRDMAIDCLKPPYLRLVRRD